MFLHPRLLPRSWFCDSDLLLDLDRDGVRPYLSRSNDGDLVLCRADKVLFLLAGLGTGAGDGALPVRLVSPVGGLSCFLDDRESKAVVSWVRPVT